MSTGTDPDLIIDARNRVWGFAVVLLVAIGLSGVMGLIFWDVVLGLNPNVGDRGYTTWEKLGWAILLTGIAAVALGGTLLLGARFIIVMRDTGTAVALRTLSVWGQRQRVIAPDQMTLGVVHRPVVRGRRNVDAPWQTLYIKGYRVPFVIDLQSTHYDERRLQVLISRAKRKTTAPDDPAT